MITSFLTVQVCQPLEYAVCPEAVMVCPHRDCTEGAWASAMDLRVPWQASKIKMPWLIFVAGTHKRNTGCSAEEVFRLLRQLCRQKAKDEAIGRLEVEWLGHSGQKCCEVKLVRGRECHSF